MALTKVKTKGITDANVTTAKTDLVSTASVAAVTAKGTSGVSDGYVTLNCDQNTHGVKLKSPPHSAAQSYTLTLPITAPATDKYLQTTSGGQLSFATVTEYDDDALQNDIATLALHQATNANAAKYNLTNTNVDVYQDSTGIASLTDCERNTTGEYVSTIIPMSTGSLTNFVAANWDAGSLSAFSAGDGTATHASSPDEDGLAVTNASATTPITFPANSAFEITGTNSTGTGRGAFMSLYKTSTEPSGSPANTTDWKWSAWEDLTDQFGWQMGSTGYGICMYGTGGSKTVILGPDADLYFDSGQWTVTRDTDGVFRIYQGTSSGTLVLTSNVTDGADFTNTAEVALAFGGTGSHSCSEASFQYTPVTPESVNATGNYVSTATTANASVSKVGIVITYKNQSGTNTLNTDIVAQVSADGGSNYSTVTLAAAGTFSTGVLQAVANDVSVTAGTSIQYKISFANQSEGSKEARITGVSLIY